MSHAFDDLTPPTHKIDELRELHKKAQENEALRRRLFRKLTLVALPVILVIAFNSIHQTAQALMPPGIAVTICTTVMVILAAPGLLILLLTVLI